jgi:hypothetical protein
VRIYKTEGPGMRSNPNAAKRKSVTVDKAGTITSLSESRQRIFLLFYHNRGYEMIEHMSHPSLLKKGAKPLVPRLLAASSEPVFSKVRDDS